MRLRRSLVLQIVIFVISVTIGIFISSAAPAAEPGCGADFEAIDGLTPITRPLVEAYAKNASSFMRNMFDTIAKRQNEALRFKGEAEIPIWKIESLEPSLIPKDSRLAGMVQRVNFLFQDRDSLANFAGQMAEQAAKKMAKLGKLESANQLLPTKPGKSQLLQNIASEQGWGPFVETTETMLPEHFRTQILTRGQLWYDMEGAELSHTGSAHALQWIYVTPILEKEFGPGAAKDLLRYFSTPEGFPLWETLFDRGPIHFRDLRGPKAFSIYRLAGPHSWFGVP